MSIWKLLAGLAVFGGGVALLGRSTGDDEGDVPPPGPDPLDDLPPPPGEYNDGEGAGMSNELDEQLTVLPASVVPKRAARPLVLQGVVIKPPLILKSVPAKVKKTLADAIIFGADGVQHVTAANLPPGFLSGDITVDPSWGLFQWAAAYIDDPKKEDYGLLRGFYFAIWPGPTSTKEKLIFGPYPSMAGPTEPTLEQGIRAILKKSYSKAKG